MQDDKALLIKLQSKDESALSALYDKYSGALYGVILRMCKDEQVAENLLQDTFLTIWDKSKDYDFEKGRFYTWAYRIAKNKTLNFLRKPNKLIQTDDLSVYSDRTQEVRDEIDHLQLKGALQNLEEHQQKAIELVYFNGLTHREAHEEMNVPLGTFKSYIKQALKRLQESYIKILSFVWILIEVIG
ncbi:MAG: RNA polymerase sigma factor [Psychroserpens sp.]|nr:RNA polymerase sigma factor [Psychroserpens sp.]